MMETRKKNIPALRFPKFEGEWEEKRLEELFLEFKSGQGITSKEISKKGLYPVYGGNGLRGYTNRYTHDGFYLLIGRQGALCGNINRSYNKAFISEHAVACKANETSDTEWLAQRLDYFNLNRLSESSAQPGLSVSKLLRFKLIVPTLPEQQKIAAFLTAVDNKLKALRKKKTLLEQYKKGVMQKIFSRELRFKKEYGKDFPEWEEKKLKDIFTITRGNVLAVNKMSAIKNEINKYPVYSSQTKFNGLTGYYSQYLYENSITWTTDGANAGDVKYRKGKFYCTNVCGVLISNKGYANKCISEMINRVSRKYVSYVGNPKLMNNVMAEIKISVPSLEEQAKIADFLSAIDKKIASVEEQIEKTGQWKKGLLQRMFV